MIVITGAAGFIGSYVASGLNRSAYKNLILVDDFTSKGKEENYKAIPASNLLNREDCFDRLEKLSAQITYVIHLGARTDTAEQDWELFLALNLDYSKRIWNFCVDHEIPLIYASSAATYGDGKLGFSDELSGIPLLKPLNSYGQSKHKFDLWALEQEKSPPSWAGLKFFNVYGPNEYHKGRMASVIFHAHRQIKETGALRLFKSHRPDYKDGEQKRDFIYVKDILKVIQFLMNEPELGDIYNLGSGHARTFNDLAASIFTAMEKPIKLSYFDTPIDIRDSYQYFTEADMQKLRNLGYKDPFYGLEEGVLDYITNFLKAQKYF